MTWLRNIYANIGLLYYEKKHQYDKSLEYFKLSMKYHLQAERLGKRDLSGILLYIGLSHFAKHEYDQAMDYYMKTLKISKKYNENHNYSESLRNIGEVYMVKGKFKKALEYFKKSLVIANKIKQNDLIMDSYLSLAKCFEKTGNKIESEKYHKLYEELKSQDNSI